MTIGQNVCGCNAVTSDATAVVEPCSCGCCASPPASKEQRIAELRVLRASLDQQLAALEDA